MPFDPSLPAPHAPLESQVIRDQLQALFVLINAVQSISGAQIDAVNTLNPGDAAQASLTLSGNVIHFSFALPRGNDGSQGNQGPPGANGQNGNDGAQGIQGIPGPPGQPFAVAAVDSVTTLPPGSAATASAFFDGSTVHLTFGLPSGNDGPPGMNGSSGQDGAQGIQGLPGEVTNAALATAIQSTSSNSNTVATMDSAFVNDPPTLADLEAMRAAYNGLVLALRR